MASAAQTDLWYRRSIEDRIDALMASLRENGGNITHACLEVGISRTHFYRCLRDKRYRRLKRALKEF